MVEVGPLHDGVGTSCTRTATSAMNGTRRFKRDSRSLRPGHQPYHGLRPHNGDGDIPQELPLDLMGIGATEATHVGGADVQRCVELRPSSESTWEIPLFFRAAVLRFPEPPVSYGPIAQNASSL